MEYEFTVTFSLPNPDDDIDDIVERLGSGGCGDALVGIGSLGRIALKFSREAESPNAAFESAIGDVQKAIPSAEQIEIVSGVGGLSLDSYSMESLRQSAYAARTELVANKGVITEKELITALGEAPWQDLNAAIQAGRLFTVELDGVQYFPAFYAAPDLNRVQLERVSQALRGLSGWTKWVFLMTPKGSLSDLTPLEALKKPGMFETVLSTAYGYAER